MKIRRALAGDFDAVAQLTDAAYAPYTALFGARPIPVTEDYAPRIGRGEVWLLESSGEPAGQIVIEQHPDHTMIFSVAVGPAFQGKGFGIALLRWADEQTPMASARGAALDQREDGAEHRALQSLWLSRNGSPAQSVPARMDDRRHG